MEFWFRLMLTLVFTAVWVVGLHWVWTNQLDPRATVSRIFKGATSPPSWVATRHPDKIYQGGSTVGDVTGPVKIKGSRIQFAQLANTTSLDPNNAFEYQRYTLRILNIGTVTGTKSVTTDTGSRVLTAVLENVECDIIK